MPIQQCGSLLAYNLLAPGVNADNIWAGGADYLIYYDYPYFEAMQYVASYPYFQLTPACISNNLFFVWAWTSANFMSYRKGLGADDIGDFEFDDSNRLVMAVPEADAVVITDPVIFGQPIAVQKILEGRWYRYSRVRSTKILNFAWCLLFNHSSLEKKRV
ncbi:MAG TPA: hypothetical protein VGB30_05975 [bacterium]|jgi:hypothetical protein